jgi:3-isopropylmalate/(R)-2-methylmalate dehydratase small subunit
MSRRITGQAYVLGPNIDTDQIIPAEHLVYSLSDPEESKKYGQYALSGVQPGNAGLPSGLIPFVSEGQYRSAFEIIIGGSNFGCGSSREHAPFALQRAGVKAVVAESFARIFYRNSVDGGFFIPLECDAPLIQTIVTGEQVEVDLDSFQLKSNKSGHIYKLHPPGDILPIIEAGGIFSYARKTGLI